MKESWKMPVDESELLLLGREFDAGPEPIVNGHLWTTNDQFSDGGSQRLYVDYRGEKAWTVASTGHHVLSPEGKLIYEPFASSRSEEFIRETRYFSPMEAMQIANAWRNSITEWSAFSKHPFDYSRYEGSRFQRMFTAQAIATLAHRGQFRKYTDPGKKPTPYIVHPEQVKDDVAKWFKDRVSPTECLMLQMVAWLHDAVEDGPPWISLYIKHTLGVEIIDGVMMLTNPSKGSKLSRAERKKMDRDHLAEVPSQYKAIKLMDRRRNLMEISSQPAAPADFKKLYARESRDLLEVLRTDDTKDLEQEVEVYINHLLAGA